MTLFGDPILKILTIEIYGISVSYQTPFVAYRSSDITAYTLDMGFAVWKFETLEVEDRNRTAPFPFCGNRFEFRAVGSSQNCHRLSDGQEGMA